MSTTALEGIQIEDADDEALREAAFRLRLTAYWSSTEWAGLSGRGLRDADDETGVILVARRGDEVVGTARMNWADAGLSADVSAGLQLGRFLEHTDKARVVVTSRLAVSHEHRGGLLAGLLMIAAAERAAARHFEVALCDCQPHLLDIYLRAGFRTYAPAFEHGEGGLVIPLALIGDDLEHLRHVRSPLTATLARSGPPRPSLTGLLDVVQGTREIGIDSEWQNFGPLYGLALDRARLFTGLDDDERERLLEHGTVLKVQPGQRLIVEAQPTRTLYVVLDGLLEIARDGRIVGFAPAGDVVGEIAALLELPRTGMVTARAPSEVLALSDRVLGKILRSDPTIAAKLALNLAREVARKLAARLPGGVA